LFQKGSLGHSFLVEAGAGSGKTSIIAGRVAFLFAQGVEPKNLAAITFTEFAAANCAFASSDSWKNCALEKFRQISLARFPKTFPPVSSQTIFKHASYLINSSARPSTVLRVNQH
jgi:exodeoxyribonuclease-5